MLAENWQLPTVVVSEHDKNLGIGRRMGSTYPVWVDYHGSLQL